jgi:hypothetical protein
MRRALRELRGYAARFFTNWRTSDAPASTKLWLTLRNRTRALVTLRGCCGHLGEPGC